MSEECPGCRVKIVHHRIPDCPQCGHALPDPYSENASLRAMVAEMGEAFREVLRISDREHTAWDRARAALPARPDEGEGKPLEHFHAKLQDQRECVKGNCPRPPLGGGTGGSK